MKRPALLWGVSFTELYLVPYLSFQVYQLSSCIKPFHNHFKLLAEIIIIKI